MKLNLGCGFCPKDGWINCDHNKRALADRFFDLKDGIPYEEGTVDEVAIENVLDSLTHPQATQVMWEIHRVLKPGGIVSIIQCDITKNPEAGFGFPMFVSPYTRTYFHHFTIGRPEHENWKHIWQLPGFHVEEFHTNNNGIMLIRMVKP
jgi:hypothetical protein